MSKVFQKQKYYIRAEQIDHRDDIDHIDKTKIEATIEIGKAKARYEFMSQSEEETIDDDGDEEEGENKRRITNRETLCTSLDYATLRATDIPMVARLIPPKPATIKKTAY